MPLDRESSERRNRNLEVLPFQACEGLRGVTGAADVLIAILEADAGVFSVPSEVLSYFCGSPPTLGLTTRETWLPGRF